MSGKKAKNNYRQLTQEEAEKRGCIYCDDVSKVKDTEYDRNELSRYMCLHSECPYKELNEISKHYVSEYDEPLQEEFKNHIRKILISF